MLDEWNAIYIKSNGERVKLSWNETYVLEYLIKHKNRVVSGRELAEVIYGKGTFLLKRSTLGTFIVRLREKLAGEILIVNRFKTGYQIKYIGE